MVMRDNIDGSQSFLLFGGQSNAMSQIRVVVSMQSVKVGL